MCWYRGKTPSIHRHAIPTKPSTTDFPVIQPEHHSNGMFHAWQDSRRAPKHGYRSMSITNATTSKRNVLVHAVIWTFTKNWWHCDVMRHLSMAPMSRWYWPELSLCIRGESFNCYKLSLIQHKDKQNSVTSRQAPSSQPFVIVLNLGKEWKTIDVASALKVPKQLKVVTASTQAPLDEGYASHSISYFP